MESAILGRYADHVRAIHPEAPTPGFYQADRLFKDAQRLRSRMGDSEFFRALNDAIRDGSAGGASGWGALGSGWDAASFGSASTPLSSSCFSSSSNRAIQRRSTDCGFGSSASAQVRLAWLLLRRNGMSPDIPCGIWKQFSRTRYGPAEPGERLCGDSRGVGHFRFDPSVVGAAVDVASERTEQLSCFTYPRRAPRVGFGTRGTCPKDRARTPDATHRG